METSVLYGKAVSEALKARLKKRIGALLQKGIRPGLAVVLVGENPASKIYVRNKARSCEALGIYSETLRLPENIGQEELNAHIDKLNADSRFHGILVQLPLPAHIDEKEIIHRILPVKDVDGFHPVNIGHLVLGEDTFIPCTPAGIMEMLAFYQIPVSGKHVVIIGRSNIVGKPMANLLYQKSSKANATVTICHTGTKDLKHHTLQADILIVAAGIPEIVTGDMVKEGVTVIDVGVNRVQDATRKKGYRLVGDVAFDSVKKHAAAITPVPGGVGLMTIAMLMQNTVKAAENHV